ncbi:glutamine-hydrolyzing carbamoyl-phosphate synthase small subunit [Burkholderiaceae bacterium FT117]|uniref:glutamine-hydrolyzing carbamoyl-phosphate synthase small subunit n=1 Tax=Zeimonas sediminis TaxID=2944268 RepID=UPI002342D0DF|nr:glutamine-hydrolyzing carbamoyl-phosphate synthase small subunit [Zeimonas sediminis]MCM5569786.1 glutamine-hydrolyzing carbamoyl-phosphate synthase small subunit [Zeimonas sediminis]
MPESAPALLALADGTVFRGRSIGAPVQAVGEVVFNTAMTGYQEILTDPSYCRQLVTLTYPHIGNYGVNDEDVEAARVHAAALIVKDVPPRLSNWRSTGTLTDYLVAQGVPGIAGIDTRKLTRLLRDKGAQNGCLVAAARPGDTIDEQAAIAAARAFPGLAGMDLAKVVSTTEPYNWTEGSWRLGTGFVSSPTRRFKVVVFDFGVKRNILRLLADRGCELIVLPAQASAADALAHQPDGIFLSNGPGDPEPCDYAIAASRELIERGLPTFGICLGHQIMGLASGARTMKMKFGHHGANHPVRDLDSGKVHITSQNHGFAVDASSMPANLRVTHVSLFDGSIQGLERTDRPAFCFQGHPEASPGPQDIHYLFDRFIELMEQGKQGEGAQDRAKQSSGTRA